ncbi:MAG TPA: 2Fe-2S iron-sulfur cluster-binding protein [Vicinamibacterales bacterium]|nr:2Fe-2S iron-sulfur cluster-binding protein [Vicinamibacterales bacterium]
METVTLTIDGRQVTVEKGRTVLQAAIEHGITVPYYCFHPGISIDGSCRVCIVKIEKMAKLQTSCSTLCTEGMVVHTRTPDVVEARAGVFEFLLINHPLDCPVCDKGGECPLQDFSYNFGPGQSRMEFARRTFDGEGVKADVDFGPTLMLNRNRCIMCSRCVRFMREIDGDAQIGIIQRGYGSEIATYREEGVHSLLSGNLMDVCPVGAITTRDYRFKSRPWDNPEAVDTICTLCSKGCNTTAWLKAKPEWAMGARLVRVTPRFNPEVNGYWMCDIGRFDYHWVEGDTRLRQPLARIGDGTQQAVSWRDLLVRMRHEFDIEENRTGLRFLLSAHASNEELLLFQQLAQKLAGDAAPHLSVGWRHRVKEQPQGTKFPVPAADAPNVHGARDLGLPVVTTPDGAADLAALRADVDAGLVTALYVFDPGPDGSLGDVGWIIDARRQGRLTMLVVQGVLLTELARAADFVLPGASWIEKEASYTNDQGRVQASARVLARPGDAKDDCQILADLATALGVPLGVTTAAGVRAELARTVGARLPAYAGLGDLAFARPVTRQTWLDASNPSERWKWDVLFQDLPPVKGNVDPVALPPPPGVIPLKEVK